MNCSGTDLFSCVQCNTNIDKFSLNFKAFKYRNIWPVPHQHTCIRIPYSLQRCRGSIFPDVFAGQNLSLSLSLWRSKNSSCNSSSNCCSCCLVTISTTLLIVILLLLLELLPRLTSLAAPTTATAAVTVAVIFFLQSGQAFVRPTFFSSSSNNKLTRYVIFNRNKKLPYVT